MSSGQTGFIQPRSRRILSPRWATSSSWMSLSTSPANMANMLKFCWEAQKAGPHHQNPVGSPRQPQTLRHATGERGTHATFPPRGLRLPDNMEVSPLAVHLGHSQLGQHEFSNRASTWCSVRNVPVIWRLVSFLPLHSPSAVSLTCRPTFQQLLAFFLPIQQKQGRLCLSISRQRFHLHPDWLLKVHGRPQANTCDQRDGVH